MKSRILLTAVSAIALGSVAPALAAGDSSGPATTNPEAAATESGDRWTSAEMIRASNLIGAEVVNDSGESIGEVEDLVFDLSAGEGAGEMSAVLSVGEWLGIGDHNVRVGLEKLKFQTVGAEGEDIRVQTSMTQEQLKSMPNYEPGQQQEQQSQSQPQ